MALGTVLPKEHTARAPGRVSEPGTAHPCVRDGGLLPSVLQETLGETGSHRAANRSPLQHLMQFKLHHAGSSSTGLLVWGGGGDAQQNRA